MHRRLDYTVRAMRVEERDELSNEIQRREGERRATLERLAKEDEERARAEWQVLRALKPRAVTIAGAVQRAIDVHLKPLRDRQYQDELKAYESNAAARRAEAEREVKRQEEEKVRRRQAEEDAERKRKDDEAAADRERTKREV